jgi:hypothetical protein
MVDIARFFKVGVLSLRFDNKNNTILAAGETAMWRSWE